MLFNSPFAFILKISNSVLWSEINSVNAAGVEVSQWKETPQIQFSWIMFTVQSLSISPTKVKL